MVVEWARRKQKPNNGENRLKQRLQANETWLILIQQYARNGKAISYDGSGMQAIENERQLHATQYISLCRHQCDAPAVSMSEAESSR